MKINKIYDRCFLGKIKVCVEVNFQEKYWDKDKNGEKKEYSNTYRIEIRPREDYKIGRIKSYEISLACYGSVSKELVKKYLELIKVAQEEADKNFKKYQNTIK